MKSKIKCARPHGGAALCAACKRRAALFERGIRSVAPCGKGVFDLNGL